MTAQGLYERASDIAQRLRPLTSGKAPLVGVVLGSGLGSFVDALPNAPRISYADIPGFPKPTVDGHAGNLVFAEFAGQPIVVMQGRVHYYEVGSLTEATLPIRVLALLGIKALVLTNSAGAINPAFSVGDLMVIKDQINLMGTNPLIGHNDPRFGPRFPDMTDAYDPALVTAIHSAASDLHIPLRSGVYCGLSGPAYETPAEIRMLSACGADAVGMSTVPEVIVARHMGVRCAGISCLSNMAAGLGTSPLNHDEVKDTAARVGQQFTALLRGSLERIFEVLSSTPATRPGV
jgi:purine-nucleoside phosphorylase